MSEDLRYYFFDNEAEPEPPISAEEGWKHMGQLLDQHLPTKKRRVAALWPYAVAASLLLIAIVSVFYLREVGGDKTIAANNQQTVPSKNPAENVAAIPSDNALLPSNNEDHKDVNNNSSSLNASNPTPIQHKPNEGLITAYNKTKSSPEDFSDKLLSDPGNVANNHVTETASGVKSTENKANTITGTTVDNSNSLALNEKINKPEQSTLPADNLPVPSLKKKDDNNKKGSWNFSAGVGVNMATAGNTQSLQPYPVAETKYNINNRLYVSAGIAPYAPTTAASSGVEKSTTVNDLARNVSRYDERTTYNRVNYLDVPLMAGVNVTKHLSLQGGVQVSWMLNNKSVKTYETYDLMMTMVDQATTMATPVGPSFNTGPVIEKETEVAVRKTDYRYVAGLQYTLKRATIGMQYQQGLQPVLSGTNASTRKNNLISLKLNFRIK